MYFIYTVAAKDSLETGKHKSDFGSSNPQSIIQGEDLFWPPETFQCIQAKCPFSPSTPRCPVCSSSQNPKLPGINCLFFHLPAFFRC